MIGTIIWNKRDPFYGLDRAGLMRTLAGRLAGRATEAWLFGSLARGDQGPDSDIDVIAVVDTELPFTRRQRLFDDLYAQFPALDLLVYTRDEFARLTQDPSPGFWREVTTTMRRLL